MQMVIERWMASEVNQRYEAWSYRRVWLINEAAAIREAVKLLKPTSAFDRYYFTLFNITPQYSFPVPPPSPRPHIHPNIPKCSPLVAVMIIDNREFGWFSTTEMRF